MSFLPTLGHPLGDGAKRKYSFEDVFKEQEDEGDD